MLITLIGTSGCDEKLSDLVGPTPNLAPTFSSIRADMPRNGPPYLTPGQITVIRRWIENGAPNN